jgi:ketosteroid isomerase-like protein
MKAVEPHLAALSPDERSLLALEDAMLAAIRRRDVRAVRGLLTADFVLLSGDGSEVGREGFLDGVTGIPGEILEVTAEHLRARVVGGVGVLTGLQRARVRLPDGTLVTETQAFTDLCIRFPDGWRMTLAHSVALEPKAG